jgi:periplasmic divalent cation tolerance protein
MENNYLIVLVTTKNKQEAETIAQKLLEERLIACANIISSVSSMFVWEGKIDCAAECLMVMKSRSDLFERLVERVGCLHSYGVPEVLALPVVAGSAAYLGWLGEVLKP